MSTGSNAVQPGRVPQRVDSPPRRLPPFHVVLLDDHDHTYEYIIDMLRRVFGHSKEDAYKMASEVDCNGRVIVDTTTLERAELKRDQIHGFGPDFRIPRCMGAMSAILQPAGKC